MRAIWRRMNCLMLAAVLFLGGITLPSRETAAASKTWNKINGVCYNGNGKKIPGAVTRGIDVSFWQGTINWKKVAGSNVDFAMIRVGYRSGDKLIQDTQYVNNISGATAAGVPAGVYFYSKARTKAQAVAEAKFVIDKIQGYKISYPIAFDLEDSSLLTGLTNTQRSRIVLAFCDKIKAAGYYPMLYCNTDWYSNHINKSLLSGIDKWLAAYADRFTSANTTAVHTIWQATSGGGSLKDTKGLIAGIPSYNNVDINFGYVDYTKKIKPRKKKGTSSASTSTSVTVNRKGWYTTRYGNRYYYKNGVPVTGLQTIDGHSYYFNSAGRMQLGKKKIGSYYYYFIRKKTSSYPMGAMVTGLYTTTSGSKYYFKTSGTNKGRMYTSRWVEMKGKKYYFQANGTMARSKTLTIKGKKYRFNKNGVCVSL